MRNGQFVQSIHPLACGLGGLATGDLFAGNPASDVISMANHDRITFFLAKGAGATGTATMTVESCDDAVPTTTTAIPFKAWASTSGDALGDMQEVAATGLTTTAGADQLYAVEVCASALAEGDGFVRLKLTEVVNDPCGGAVVAILSGSRYVDDRGISAI
jgi:hypothetical protein